MHEHTMISTSRMIPMPLSGTPDTHAMTVLQVGRLITDRHQSLCKIRSISAAGVMAHTTVPLAEGQEVVVGFRTSHCLPGRVAWVRDELVCVEFFEPADIDALFAAQRRAVSGRFLPESVRLDVYGTATLDIDGHNVVTELFDISLSGAKVAATEALAVDARVILTIDGLPARSGYLRWRTDGRAGIAFNLSMPFDVLASWVLDQTPRVTLGMFGQKS